MPLRNNGDVLLDQNAERILAVIPVRLEIARSVRSMEDRIRVIIRDLGVAVDVL